MNENDRRMAVNEGLERAASHLLQKATMIRNSYQSVAATNASLIIVKVYEREAEEILNYRTYSVGI